MKTLALDDTGRESDAQIKHFDGSFFGADFRNKNKAKVPKHRRFGTFLIGRGTRTRTLGTWFWRPMLYQLSYTPILTPLEYYTKEVGKCQVVFIKF